MLSHLIRPFLSQTSFPFPIFITHTVSASLFPPLSPCCNMKCFVPYWNKETAGTCVLIGPGYFWLSFSFCLLHCHTSNWSRCDRMVIPLISLTSRIESYLVLGVIPAVCLQILHVAFHKGQSLVPCCFQLISNVSTAIVMLIIYLYNDNII